MFVISVTDIWKGKDSTIQWDHIDFYKHNSSQRNSGDKIKWHIDKVDRPLINHLNLIYDVGRYNTWILYLVGI
jgi:hypothetical protein